jgi:flavodoxin
MEILVAYDGEHGQIRQVADAVADAAASRGVATILLSVGDIEPTHVDSADGVIAGCWTPGDVPFGGKPTRRMATWIDSLPPLNNKPVGVFCLFRFFPHTFADTTTRVAESLDQLSNRFEMKGANVAVTQSIHTKSIDEDATLLVDALFGLLTEVSD